MLHAAQPWLPLLDPGPEADAPARAARRSRGRASVLRPAATAAAAETAPAVPAGLPPEPHPCPALHPGELRALRLAVLGLVMRWELTGQDALALLGEPLAGEQERLERMKALSGVNRSLLLLFPECERCLAFLHGPCPALDGAAPLGLMLAEGCPGIARVSAHLVARVRHPLGG